MEIVKNLNRGLSFLLELGALGAFGYWGAHLHRSTLVKVVAVIGAPLAVAVIWGVWLAPNSGRQLAMPWLTLGKLAVFGLATLALYAAQQPRLAIVFGIVVIANTGLSLALGDP